MKLPKEHMILELNNKKIIKSLKLVSIPLNKLILKPIGKVHIWILKDYKVNQKI